MIHRRNKLILTLTGLFIFVYDLVQNRYHFVQEKGIFVHCGKDIDEVELLEEVEIKPVVSEQRMQLSRICVNEELHINQVNFRSRSSCSEEDSIEASSDIGCLDDVLQKTSLKEVHYDWAVDRKSDYITMEAHVHQAPRQVDAASPL